jgi:UDP-glucuronate decarboxylase
VDDLIEAVVRIMATPDVVTGPINIGNPIEMTVIHLARQILALTGSSSPIQFVPLPSDDPKQRRPDIRYAKEVLGWEPKVLLEEGLKATIDHFRKILGPCEANVLL